MNAHARKQKGKARYTVASPHARSRAPPFAFYPNNTSTDPRDALPARDLDLIRRHIGIRKKESGRRNQLMSRLSEITQKQRDRLRENANRMAGGIPFIQYDGESVQFKLGETDVTDNNFLSVPDRCEAVWICFSGGTVKELVRVNMLDEDIPSRPQGYSDRQKWDTWDKGRNEGQPKDPLMLQYELPLVTLDFARDEPRLQDRLHAHS